MFNTLETKTYFTSTFYMSVILHYNHNMSYRKWVADKKHPQWINDAPTSRHVLNDCFLTTELVDIFKIHFVFRNVIVLFD